MSANSDLVKNSQDVFEEVDNQSHVSETPDPPVKIKQLQLPLNKNKFATWIDEGSEIDEQGYPIYPNGETIFVKNEEDSITNFQKGMATIAWTHTMRTEHNEEWTIRRYYCLGLLYCSEKGCQLAGSPPTGHKGIEKHLAKYVILINQVYHFISNN